MSRSAIRAKKQQKQKLTPAQRKFNATIRKIEKQKKLLADWQAMTAEFQQQQAGTYAPLMERYNRGRAELVRMFDRFFVRKSFSGLQREKMAHAICEMSTELIPAGFDDLKDIHDRYSDLDFDTMEQEEKGMAEDMLRDLFEQEFGVDMGDDFDMDRPEEMADRVVEQLEEKQREAEQAKAGKKQTKKQAEAAQRKADKEKEEEENISQSIKSVYRQLTTALHPDRETDDSERERKTELMQKVTRAYRDKDLLQLLELQLEVEQIDQSKIDGIADSRLKHFNKVLERQLDEILAEIDMVSLAFKQMARIHPMDDVTPQAIMEQFEDDMAALELDVTEIEDDLTTLTTVKGIQQWLKDYHLPRQDPFGNFAELFGGVPPDFFR